MDAAPLVKLEAESEPAETRGRLKMDAGAGSGPMGDSYTRDANDGNVPCSTAADMEDLDHSSAKVSSAKRNRSASPDAASFFSRLKTAIQRRRKTAPTYQRPVASRRTAPVRDAISSNMLPGSRQT